MPSTCKQNQLVVLPIRDQTAGSYCISAESPLRYRRGESGELIPHEAEQEAIREIVALRAQGKPPRAIAEAVAAKGHCISHEGVASVLRAADG
jgi:putative DNA-invertase from lambdoid prophage Rac